MSLVFGGVGLLHPNGHRALRQVSLTVRAGERLAIVGPSGAGKTSLLRLAAAALRPSDGTVETLGLQPWHLRAGALRRLRGRIGLVHQVPPVPPRLRVVTAVLAGRLGVWPARRALASLVFPADAAGAGEVLARLQMADRLFDRCDRLSGGQLQRIGIARVLYQSPELLLADEPVSALDPALANLAVGALVAQSESTGATLVASLHAVDLALRWFPRLVGLRAGAVLFDAATADVSPGMLHALYATEGAALPTQRDNPAALPPRFDATSGRPGECAAPDARAGVDAARPWAAADDAVSDVLPIGSAPYR